MNIYLSKALCIVLLLLLANIAVYGQYGPGGVGSASTNPIWLDPSYHTSYTDADPVDTLLDRSGNDNHFIQGTSADRPIFRTNILNGYPMLEFGGDGDHLEDADGESYINGLTGYTLFIVSESNGTNDDIGIFDTEAPDGSDDVLCLRHDAAGVNGGGTNLWKMGISTSGGQIQLESSNNSQTTDPMYVTMDWESGNGIGFYVDGTLDVPTDAGASATGAMQGANTVLLGVGPKDATTNGWDGYIGEVIFFNYKLNNAERYMVDNYLAAKYDLSTYNDLYGFESTHRHDVAGVGRETVGNEHLSAQSGGILQVNSVSTLADGEYLLFGHDSAQVNWAATEVPAGGSLQRIAREWRFDETGTVGDVVLSIDTTALPAKPANFTQYILWVDADGNFTTGATPHVLSLNAGRYETDSITIADGAYVAIGVLQPKVNLDVTSSSIQEFLSTDTFTVSLNYALNIPVSFDYEVTGGTATGAGNDYSLNDSTLTIPAGATSVQFVLYLENDPDIESSETIEITLRNPAGGLSLGDDSILTVTILDDDLPRDIQFTNATGINSENDTTLYIELSIDVVDPLYDTEVDYAITSGTATGGGEDYTFTSGRATILATQSTTSISLTIHEDALDEFDETLVISLSNPANANIGINNTFTYTISDNDLPPTVDLVATSGSGDESTSPVSIDLELSEVSAKDITVYFSSTGSDATQGSDFSLPGSSILIPAGDSTASIALSIVNDNDLEFSEEIEITIGSADNATIGSNYVFTYTINASDAIGYSGPGGVGDDQANQLWIAADQLNLTNGANVSLWSDSSGNGHDLIQSTAGNYPIYRTNQINGRPAIEFDGTNDFLEDADGELYINGQSAFTMFSVVRSNAVGNDNGFFITKTPDGSDDALAIRYDVGGANGGGTNVMKVGVSASGDLQQYESGNNVQTTSTQIIGMDWVSGSNFNMYFNGTTDTPTDIEASVSGVLDNADRVIVGKGSKDAADAWNGLVAEIIFFSNKLNITQRTIIENYLGAKYNVAVANDYYSYDATHSYQVAGIGYESVADFHGTAQAGGLLTVSNPSDLGAGEYLMFGHDNGDLTTYTYTESPNSYTERFAREWRFDETGDVGTIDITLDDTQLPARNSSMTAYILLVDADGDFSDGADMYYMAPIGGNEYRASDVNISDGAYVAFAAIENIAATSGYFSNTANWSAGAVPEGGDLAVIASNVTITLDNNTIVGEVYLPEHAELNTASYELELDNGTISGAGTFNPGTGTVEYAEPGDQTIAPYDYYNLTISGSGIKTITRATVISGDLTISAGTLDVDLTNNYQLTVAGDWTNTGGTFEARAGIVEFNGTDTQFVAASSSAFYNATVNNTDAGLFLQNGSMEISNQLTFTSGVITTDTNRVYISTNTASAIAGHSNTSFINGNLRRAIGTNTSTYDFPVGNGVNTTNYYLAQLENNNLTGISYIDARFKPLTNHNNGQMTASDLWIAYSAMYTDGVWELEPDAQPTLGSYDVRLHTENFTGLQDNDFAVLKRPVGSTTGADWSTGGGLLNIVGGLGRMVSDGFALRMGLTGFSEFGLGSGGAALPIELLSFTANAANDKVVLEWSTAIEINNDYFTIERSKDGTHFEEVLTVEGAGNSSAVQYYQAEDLQPLDGTSYYRLKQTDFDGAFEYAPIVAVNFNDGSVYEVTVYPNPVTNGKLYIDINSTGAYFADDLTGTMEIVDLSGRMILQQDIYAGQGKLTVDLPADLQSGYYMLNVFTRTFNKQEKLLVR